jgi:DNA modification methylase
MPGAWEMNKILQGSALEQLKTLPDESINCCMTSPPYWSLRDYGSNNSQIWGGNKDCEHDFKIEIKKNPMDRGGKGQHDSGGIVGKMGDKTNTSIENGFCSKCNAWKGQLGLEPTFDLYIKNLCDIFDEVKRVLRNDGTCWVNLGDTYGGSGNSSGHTKETKNLGYTTSQMGASKGNQKATKGMEKSLCNIPARFSIEMQNRGWILRNVIIWHKNNCMPSSVQDRFTIDFEYLFFFVKSKRYWFETQREPHKWADKDKRSKLRRVEHKSGKSYLENSQQGFKGVGYHPNGRNKRAVWNINTKPFKEAHFAVYPEQLCETPIKAGCPVKGIVLDPFFGAGTTGLVALKQNKKFIGIELNPEYIKIAQNRLKPYLEQEVLQI